MININHIGQKDEYNYRFPTIDFKFQNTGTATAFLWQFEIDVFRIDVNLTPVIKLSCQIKVVTLERGGRIEGEVKHE